MELRWTEAAAADLDSIAEYLFAHAPDRAAGLLNTLYDAPESLLTFPKRGRPGKMRGTRELVVASLPWIVVYTVGDEAIHIVRILHGAQRWP